MNTPSVDTIEKKTLMMRLFVNIYRMTDAQLHHLLTILDQGEDAGTGHSREMPAGSTEDKGEMYQRHAIIARLFVLIRQMDKDKLLDRLETFGDPELHWWRSFPRMDCNLIVDFAVQGKAYRGYMRDISAGGIYIVSSDNFEIDQEISMCFSISDSNENMPFKLNGRISQIYPNGIGVKYHDIPYHQQTAIDAMVQKKIEP